MSPYSNAELERSLRIAAGEVREFASLMDTDQFHQRVMGRIRSGAMEREHVLQVADQIRAALAPICGPYLAEQSTRMALEAEISIDAKYIELEQWDGFVASLQNILSAICGASVGNAVSRISSVLAAAA